MKIRKHTGENKAPDFRVDDKGTLWYKDRICVPKEGDFRQMIMDEAHNSAYSIHPRVHQNVFGFKIKLLVKWNEVGHCPVRCPLRYMPKDQGLAPEASRITTTSTYSSLEMGRDRNGFCGRIAQDPERL